jgi:tripartite-type tricarboxylate transporter receptor subunit TctC
VNQSVPARNMKEFMAWAQQGKGKLSYGSYGTGSAGHLMSAYLSQSRNLEMSHVPYKSEGPYIQDLAGGVVPWGIGTLGPMLPHMKTGRVRPLAVMAAKRLPELPDVPTMAEAGFPDKEFLTVAWFTLSAPAGTPKPILDLLEKQAREISQSTPMKARFQVFGLEGVGGSAEQFRRNFEATSPPTASARIPGRAAARPGSARRRCRAPRRPQASAALGAGACANGRIEAPVQGRPSIGTSFSS